jgi:ABC-2 type transport system permease protein
VITLALPIALSIVLALVSNNAMTEPNNAFGATVVAPSMIAVYLCGVLGVLGIGQEYRHNTIRVTFAAQPRRSRVLAGKTIVYGTFGLLVGIVTPALCLLTSSIIMRARNLPYEANGAALVGIAVFCLLTTLFGFGLGCVMRQPAGAIPVFLLWPLLVESIVGAIFSSVNPNLVRWLPFRSGQHMVNFGGDSMGGGGHFSRVVSGAYFGVWTLVLVVLGWWLVERRDA